MHGGCKGDIPVVSGPIWIEEYFPMHTGKAYVRTFNKKTKTIYFTGDGHLFYKGEIIGNFKRG